MPSGAMVIGPVLVKLPLPKWPMGQPGGSQWAAGSVTG